MKMFYLFVFSHYPTQNRFALLLEMLQFKGCISITICSLFNFRSYRVDCASAGSASAHECQRSIQRNYRCDPPN
ncbi:hypothetical protein CQ052_13900 [Ochrobactrum sp. MYb15]|nr:hypothetical protein CQZ90_07025 [Ochrobactrum sp. MYb19]PRA68392.1 hypothetical protein CQ053_02015 [Ochrobactrum sp. MYb18]PRA74380.1 hypothetical protein CQ049_14065 [Brucella thiophenivorans]PRA90644.1 hypothetical protein CQ051_11920 [Ochrobactrum sp. MYb14]PRA96095.1 hypothetical protein CQ052_13900 [Ochrobactrum sp. MYb15]